MLEEGEVLSGPSEAILGTQALHEGIVYCAEERIMKITGRWEAEMKWGCGRSQYADTASVGASWVWVVRFLAIIGLGK